MAVPPPMTPPKAPPHIAPEKAPIVLFPNALRMVSVEVDFSTSLPSNPIS